MWTSFVVGCGPHVYRPFETKFIIYQLLGRSIDITLDVKDEFDDFDWIIDGGSHRQIYIQQLRVQGLLEIRGFRLKIDLVDMKLDGITVRGNITKNNTFRLGKRVKVKIGGRNSYTL